MNRGRKVAAGSMLFLLIAGVLGACSSSDSPAAGGSDGGSVGEQTITSDILGKPVREGYDDAGTAVADTTSGASSGGGGSGGFLAGPPSVGPSVIKTAYVELEVERDSLQEATRDSIAIAGKLGGFVLSTSTEDDRHPSASVTLRVPAVSFERALTELEDLGKVEAEQISGEDVGAEFVDLEARLRNLESQETVLLRLMGRSQSVSDTIRVQRELQGVQLEIERLTGRLRYLRDQAEMATINLSFTEVGAPADRPPSGVIAKAWERALDLALGVVAAVIVGTGFLIPVMVLGLFAYLILRALRPRLGS